MNQKNIQRRRLSDRVDSVLAEKFSRGKTMIPAKPARLEKVSNRSLIRRRRKIMAFLLFIVVLACFAIFILTRFVLSVEVSGGQVNLNQDDLSSYEKSINEYYSRNPFERMVASLNRDLLLADIQRKHPEIESVADIKMSGMAKYKFILKIRKPIALWEYNGKKIFVDSGGVAFGHNVFSEPEIVVFDESLIRVDGGSSVVATSFVKFIGKTVFYSESKGMKVVKVRIPPASLRQVEFYYKGVGYPVRFSTDKSSVGQVDNFIISKGFFEKEGIKPEFLDLRVEGRGYYK